MMGYWAKATDHATDMAERKVEIGGALTAARAHHAAGHYNAGEAEYEMGRVMARAYNERGGQLPEEYVAEIRVYTKRAALERQQIADLMARGMTYAQAVDRIGAELEVDE